MPEMNRRDFVRISGLSALGFAVACSSGAKTTPTTGRSIDDVIAGRSASYRFDDASVELLSGSEMRMAFALTSSSGEYMRGGKGTFWIAKDRTSAATGPIPFTYHGDGLDDADSRGVFAGFVTFPSDGPWLVLVEAEPAAGPAGLAAATVTVGARANMPKPGEKAISVATPTFDDARGVDPICTLRPKPCSMHDISLDAALANGKPTVLYIGTPQFCTSRLCGPVVQVVDSVKADEEFASALNFVHIEQFKDDSADTIQKQILAPAAEAWRLAFEPIVYFIAADGTISHRYAGPVDRADIRDGARKLLG